MKELIKQYIKGIKAQEEKETLINNAFGAINPDNVIFGLIDAEFYKTVELLWQRLLPSSKLDWITWWIYEADCGEGRCTGVSDSTGICDLKTFDEFYAFVFEDKTLAEIFEHERY